MIITGAAHKLRRTTEDSKKIHKFNNTNTKAPKIVFHDSEFQLIEISANEGIRHYIVYQS